MDSVKPQKQEKLSIDLKYKTYHESDFRESRNEARESDFKTQR